MIRFALVLCVALGCGNLIAQKFVWQPSRGHTQVPIWPKGRIPDSQVLKDPEFALTSGADSLAAGKPVTEVDNVSLPTMTIYSPKGQNTGTAIVVFPGGGYYVLAIDLEGTEVCDWLTSRGITCVLLKYRVPDSGPHGGGGRQQYPVAPTALEDAQRTMRVVRFNAARYRINPGKVGVLGFSAGGYLAADISTNFDKRLYSPVDEADKLSARPDFAISLYPGHMATSRNGLGLTPRIPVSRQTPPTFLLQAEDDHVDNVNDSLTYYIALKNAGVPAEIHLYAHGGHGFGLRKTNQAITEWPSLVERWMRSIKITSE